MKTYLLKTHLSGLLIFSILSFHFKPRDKEQLFNDWNFSQKEAFGIGKLTHPSERNYYKIIKIDEGTTRIQKFNAAGVITQTTEASFENGKIKMITETDRWGYMYKITHFTSTIANGFSVTQKTRGINDLAPCKEATYIYKDNLLIEKKYLSYTNHLINNASGVAIIKYKRYDDPYRFSLLKEQSFFDSDGKPVISKAYDCHKVIYQYDERANEISEEYIGLSGEVVSNRYGISKVKYQFDSNDNLIETAYYGKNENLIQNSYGVAKTSYGYEKGLFTKEVRYDQRNSICKASEAGDGIAIITHQYDDMGNEVKRSFFDEFNNPVNSHQGYHEVAYHYFPSNMLEGVKYYDKNLLPVPDNYGIHNYSYQRDDKGRVIQMAYFDKDGSAIKDNIDQVYLLKYKYDNEGRASSISYWKDNNTKMVRWDGYHEEMSRYNENGLKTETLYLDETGNLFNNNDGYSRLKYIYNNNAQIIVRQFFNDQTPVLISEASIRDYHAIHYTYDSVGRISEIKYLDKTGKPLNATVEIDGLFTCHKVEFIYQGSRLVQEKCYLVDGKTPVRLIDCLKNNHINSSGVSSGFKNQ